MRKSGTVSIGDESTDLVRIVFDLPKDNSEAAEVVWAVKMDEGYKVQNIPIWVYGIALDDIVSAERDTGDGRLHFTHLIRPSGLLTVRAAGPDADPLLFEQVIETLKQASEAAEKYNSTYWVFAYEPAAYKALKSYIEKCSDQNTHIYVEISNQEEQ